jgi:hypothetical protein
VVRRPQASGVTATIATVAAHNVPAHDFAIARTKPWTHTVTMSGSGQEYRVAAGVMDLRNERSGITTMDITR